MTVSENNETIEYRVDIPESRLKLSQLSKTNTRDLKRIVVFWSVCV
jgi:hypothetical protein